MPVKLKSVGQGKVQVKTPGGIKAKATTPAKAQAQKRLLNAIDHGYDPAAARQRFAFNCETCGVRNLAVLGHYDKTHCVCGKVYWALQPKRGGPLKLAVHPGTA